ncbi:calcium-binding protein [uncultured Tateyamaria sp.]|uniref:calcium-binding protein n=1 Tax=uncultured Tateyamaria sp. TaxID=455651 RepID=UPI00262D1174|nr:calcium-binding protein [uncultured Tateyamaria sp.]
MPTNYVEKTVFPMGTIGPYFESFNDGVPIDFEVGDTVSGNVGVPYISRPDSQDQIVFNVQAGVAYVFEVTVQKSGSDVWIAVGDDSVQIPFTEPEGEYTFTLGLPYDANGTSQLSISAGSSVTYTFTVLQVIYPDPSEGDDYIVGNMTSDRVDLLGGNDTYVALGGSDVITGGMGDDSIDGVCGNDTLEGNEGNDTLLGGNGRDVLIGGDDNDLLDGGNQQDMLDGGDGNDTLIGDKGDDTLIGGDGDDEINGGKDNDEMTGGAGRDVYRIRNGEGQDTITDFTQGEDLIDLTTFGIWDISQVTIQDLGSGVRINTGGGNYVELTGLTTADLSNADFILEDAPIILATDGGDVIQGTGAGDTFIMLGGADLVRGGAGRDFLAGGTGRDTIFGDDGADSLRGGSGSDQIFGGRGNDLIEGGSDNDQLLGNNGRDFINGGNGNDRIIGGSGSDSLIGENGNDMLNGNSGRDSIMGGAGQDTILGGGGADTIEGGWGDDELTGGAGADLFVFADDRTRADTITDFGRGADVIQIGFYGFTDISDLNLNQVGNDAVITLSDRDSITIENTLVTDLTNADFDFI